jgi:hypothetical protein
VDLPVDRRLDPAVARKRVDHRSITSTPGIAAGDLPLIADAARLPVVRKSGYDPIVAIATRVAIRPILRPGIAASRS